MLKLSEAIRLGAMLKPQEFGMLLSSRGASCAIGAALDACGRLHFASEGADARALWPILNRPHGTDDLFTAITRLNDDDCLSREEIAEWVETIELQQAAAAVDPHGWIEELTPVHARTEALEKILG